MSVNMTGFMTIRINPEIKGKFLVFSEAIGRNPSDLIRSFIDFSIKNTDVEEYQKIRVAGYSFRRLLEKTTICIIREDSGNTVRIVEAATKAFDEFMTEIVQKMAEKNENIKSA